MSPSGSLGSNSPAAPSDVLLAGLGILLTTVYIGGLIFRPERQYLRLGPDSIAVVLLYGLGVAAPDPGQQPRPTGERVE